ncbi:hypothetical protein NPIL_498531 [Nephila pilipes]|uniref:Uncharacterized protein n=1 Tax=Nephila pilipes TaxID=299642 RepID=A0A8X6J833_NEPPI|nr:hypothetical protein NPIL_498531 [Nephila pilipes]
MTIKVRGKLFASRRGVDHVASAGASRCERYTYGERFAVAEHDGGTDPAVVQDPHFLRKIFLKTRNGYDLASAEGKAIQDVQEMYPEWQPEEPRPFVVFSEWKLPVDDNDHGRNYFIRFRFPMRTRDDLILDAIPMRGAERGRFLVVKARPPNRF